jgi:hypothetical protein
MNGSFALLFSLLLLVGCGGEGGSVDGGGLTGGIIPEPEPLIIDGEWGTDTTEVLDTCGFDPFPSYAPLLVEDSGNSVIFTFTDGYGNCEQSVRVRNGNTVTLTRTDTFDAGCGIVRVQSNMVYEFTETTLSGTSTHQYSVLDGYCGNVPCTYQLAIGGTRCNGCWTGCADPYDAGTVESPVEAEGVQNFDGRKR